jgi:hypothetical protein
VRPNANALRGASQLVLRAAVNRTVSTVSLVVPGLVPETCLDVPADLGDTFPNATKVNMDMVSDPEMAMLLPGTPRESLPQAAGGATSYAHEAACPSFLHQPSVAALATFLSR